jgi:hypothetical protein
VIRPSEVQILILSVAFAPLIVWTYRGIDLPNKRWVAYGLAALFAAYVATVVEGFVAETALNAIEHLLYAVSAGCFLTASVGLLRLRHAAERDERA